MYSRFNQYYNAFRRLAVPIGILMMMLLLAAEEGCIGHG